jgi:hypothetical protein
MDVSFLKKKKKKSYSGNTQTMNMDKPCVLSRNASVKN